MVFWAHVYLVAVSVMIGAGIFGAFVKKGEKEGFSLIGMTAAAAGFYWLVFESAETIYKFWSHQ